MHAPVLLHETLEGLDVHPGMTVVDCNLNRAGHGIEIIKKLGNTGTFIGIDLDTTAINEAAEKLSKLDEHPRMCLLHDNFRNIDVCLADANVEMVDRVLYDLGLSSQELDISGRGFTFQKDEPLYMTYQSEVLEDTLTARDILNLWSEETLADIIYHYGDERYARRIAKTIVETRKKKPFETTFDLVSAIDSSVPKAYTYGKTHQATKTFQAIRIAVNDEIEALKESLEKSFMYLKSGGRISVITFHSLEDRIVKEFFKSKVSEGVAILHTKKPIAPSLAEVRENPRARSSKLRTLIKI